MSHSSMRMKPLSLVPVPNADMRPMPRQRKSELCASTFADCYQSDVSALRTNSTATSQSISDNSKISGNVTVCSNCNAFNTQCTHQGRSKRFQGFDGSNRTRPLKTPQRTSLTFSSEFGQSVQETDPYNGKNAAEHVETILVQSTAYIASHDLRNILLDISRYCRKLEEALKMDQSPSQ
ncbi:hypothetical protein K438DRAFT_419549 [Mycena galopus ATCC 62051]|nr:hypothetical protein K438DRAFT_419549 [Mycena galopus ATCC 62051]